MQNKPAIYRISDYSPPPALTPWRQWATGLAYLVGIAICTTVFIGVLAGWV